MISFIKGDDEMFKKIIGVTFISLVFISCGSKEAIKEQETATPNASEQEETSFSLKEALTVLDQGSVLLRTYYSYENLPTTTRETKTFLEETFTEKYINNIILGGGNLKEVNGEWSLAYEGSEFLEATFYFDTMTNPIFEKVNETTATVTDEKGDGLYAPHKEVLTLILEDGSWKIDDLVWEY